MEKLLVLGGKPIGSIELVQKAKAKGIYTIVTDYLPIEESPAKKIADEYWDISVDDIETLTEKVKKENINGVIAGVHEFCLRKAIQICERCGLPSWCSLKQWDNCSNKKAFKELCDQYGIDIAKTYKKNDNISFPVIVKPVDSDGSRGFSICHDKQELEDGIRYALDYSKDYLIEEFMQCEACIIHYTAINGEIVFSGISDKHSRKLEGGSMVMALQTFPSKAQEKYLREVDQRAKKMFKSIGIKNCPIWIEAFFDGQRFVFNEMALRFGGSMTNYPVLYNIGIDQIDLFIDAALGIEVNDTLINSLHNNEKYAILPIHLKEGKIVSYDGVKQLFSEENIKNIVLVHHAGDEIKNWGTAQQVFCYVHFTYKNQQEMLEVIKKIKEMLIVKNEYKENMLYFLMSFDEICEFN